MPIPHCALLDPHLLTTLQFLSLSSTPATTQPSHGPVSTSPSAASPLPSLPSPPRHLTAYPKQLLPVPSSDQRHRPMAARLSSVSHRCFHPSAKPVVRCPALPPSSALPPPSPICPVMNFCFGWEEKKGGLKNEKNKEEGWKRESERRIKKATGKKRK
ncbi:hypothetical protein M0R45_030701 [Rubus argutus]|uniref:Uncharacterized protein n=1 Tax=Rubus argutus TaxID=59490 RepID=A0AAW1WDY5_RUBAR